MIEDIEKQLNQAQEIIRIAKEMDTERQKALMDVAVGLVKEIRTSEAEEDDE